MPAPNDELTQARRGRTEVQVKLEQEQDEEMVKYYHLVIAQWDKYIKQIEKKLQEAQRDQGNRDTVQGLSLL